MGGNGTKTDVGKKVVGNTQVVEVEVIVGATTNPPVNKIEALVGNKIVGADTGKVGAVVNEDNPKDCLYGTIGIEKNEK